MKSINELVELEEEIHKQIIAGLVESRSWKKFFDKVECVLGKENPQVVELKDLAQEMYSFTLEE